MELTLDQIIQSNQRKIDIINSSVDEMFKNLSDYIRNKFGDRQIILSSTEAFNVTDEKVTLNTNGIPFLIENEYYAEFLQVSGLYLSNDTLYVAASYYTDVETDEADTCLNTINLKIEFIEYIARLFKNNE